MERDDEAQGESKLGALLQEFLELETAIEESLTPEAYEEYQRSDRLELLKKEGRVIGLKTGEDLQVVQLLDKTKRQYWQARSRKERR